MRPGEWAVPLAAAVATAGLLLIFSPLENADRDEADAAAQPPFKAPFADVMHADGAGPVLVVWTGAPLAGPYPGPRAVVEAFDVEGHVQAPRILFLDADTLPAAPDAPVRAHPAATDATRVPADGNATVRLTLYVFDGQGRLVASNDDEDRRARFTPYGDGMGLPDLPVHLGTDPAPQDAWTPPAYRDEARALLAGLPVGGVRSIVIDDHPYAWATGSLYVTARVDRVVAPGTLS